MQRFFRSIASGIVGDTKRQSEDDSETEISLFQRLARSCCDQLAARLFVLDAIDQSILQTIDFGVVTHLATWSGPSIASLKLLAEILSSPEFIAIPIFVANFDRTTYPSASFEGVAFGGYGETFWIKGGHVLAGLQQIESKTAAISNCHRLLDAESQS